MASAEYLKDMLHLASLGKLQGIWFWAALYFLLACSYSVWQQLATWRWPWTRGDLLQLSSDALSPAFTPDDINYTNKAVYTYQVGGKTYHGSRISPWVFTANHNARVLLNRQQKKIARLPGGQVRVYYRPDKPAKSFLIIASKTGVLVTSLLAVLPALAYWARYHA